MHAPTGEWKSLVAAVIFAFVGAGWLMAFVKKVGEFSNVQHCNSLGLNWSLNYFLIQSIKHAYIDFFFSTHQESQLKSKHVS